MNLLEALEIEVEASNSRFCSFTDANQGTAQTAFWSRSRWH